jgi:NAD dependent epimerase/dehydratase family enzyme
MSTLTLESQVHFDATMPTLPDDATYKTMRILIAGAGGMIGSAVAPCLAQQGHTVVRLVRRAPGAGEVRWDPDTGAIEAAGLEGFDGVLHVASLPQARWTATFIQRWRENHIGTNRLLAETLAHCQEKPCVLVCASAQGIYPTSGDQVLTEDSAAGTDYLAELLRDGEQATT